MLEAAHRGYDYQDLLVATRLTDVLTGNIVSTWVDEKLVSDDQFDDLTTVDLDGFRQRVQFKHRDNDDIPLPLSTFTTDARNLRFDRLVASAVADRAGPGALATAHEFRIVLRDASPNDPQLLRVLRPVSTADHGPFLPGMHSLRFSFDIDHLWPIDNSKSPVDQAVSKAFAFLRDGRLKRSDVSWFCEHLIVEVEAPAASFDLTQPGLAETLLLNRVRRDIGAESYPNTHRSAVDVAAAMIGTARAARFRRASISPNELLRRANLRHDFGAVARAHPIDTSLEVSRKATVADVVAKVTEAIDQSVPFLLILGPPGQGKSWACQRVVEALSNSRWLVGEHYCFLGDADEEREVRVLAESVIGSLLARLAEAEPDLVTDQRPRFAADEQTLVDALRQARKTDPHRHIALVVDGIDHVTRVLGATSGRIEPSRLLSEQLARLSQLPGVVVIVFSQPGEHLQPFRDARAISIEMPGLDSDELRQLAERWKVISAAKDVSPLEERRNVNEAVLGAANEEKISDFLDVLSNRSAGNALYATYLCREVFRSPEARLDPAGTLQSLPAFDGTLAAYYEHLISALGDGSWVADVIALLNFSVSRPELREIRPEMAHRIDAALEQLKPVLIERATQGGIRIYHESFARFLLGPLLKTPSSMTALLDRVAHWLGGKGIFKDARAFRFLLPTLARAERDKEVVELVGSDFVTKSIAGGFTADAIRVNLAVVVGCAAKLGDWPAVVRCVELSRAASTYEYERLDSSIVQFADVVMAILTPEIFAERLLYDGRTTVPARSGLQLCNEIDKAGAIAPWDEYLNAFDREREKDNTAYGEDSDRHISLCILRGRLRLAAAHTGSSSNTSTNDSDRQLSSTSKIETEESSEPAVDLNRLMEWLNNSSLSASSVIDAVWDTLGERLTSDLVSRMKKSGSYALAFAERLKREKREDNVEKTRHWSATALTLGVPVGEAHKLFALGLTVDEIEPRDLQEARESLLSLAREAQDHRVQFDPEPVLRWLDACTIAARRDPIGLAAAEALLQGEGWYRCWLRFTAVLCRAEALSKDQQSPEALKALELLTGDLRPFVGDPRACDLYRLHALIASTLRRALSLLDDSSWSAGVNTLVRVCDETSTTLFGELGGPVARDVLLDLVVDDSNPARQEACAAIVSSTLDEAAGHRYYTDIARFHLTAARLALKSGRRDGAQQHWESATKFLAAYGMRRDITLYELLDSLPALITISRQAAQQRLATLQPLCDRVLVHTDGKDTRGVRRNWWRLLATADPVGLANLIAPALFSKCNMPDDELEEARADLWRSYFDSVDPFIAAGLRLTLEMGLASDDPETLRRLHESDNSALATRMLRLLIARSDERPMRYPYSNSSDLIATDDERVGKINEIATLRGIAPVLAFPDGTFDNSGQRHADGTQHRHQPRELLSEVIESSLHADIEVRSGDILGIVTAWRRRPYGAREQRWDLDRFANILGYRILEIASQGNSTMAEAAIRTIADSTLSDSDCTLLAAIAEGLEIRGIAQLAVIAHTLTWTRSRGHGGWLTFGGETRLESLRRAATRDKNAALNIIASEVASVIRGGRYGTYGITKALVIAFAEIDLAPDISSQINRTSIEISLKAWDEAALVIGERLPRVSVIDDVDLPYQPSFASPHGGVQANASDELAGQTVDIESALTLVAFAGLSHPSREQKRRSLIAVEALCAARSKIAGDALRNALETLPEPGTLSWLLRTIHELPSARESIISSCITQLQALCNSPFITVRALARQLLTSAGIDPGPLPYLQAVPELNSGSGPKIWTPPPSEAIQATDGVGNNGTEGQPADDATAKRRKAAFILEDIAGKRLARAEELLPGLRSAVHEHLLRAIGSEEYDRRLKRQIDRLTSRSDFHWPDAFIAPYEVVEETLQRVAGGGRSARAIAGKLVTDPSAWEGQLAARLENRTSIAMALERARTTRPEHPLPPGRTATIWRTIAKTVAEAAPTGSETAETNDGELAATVALENAYGAPTVSLGPYKGWRILALAETRTLHADGSYPRKPDIFVSRYCAIELRVPGDKRALDVPPFGVGGQHTWWTQLPANMPIRILEGTTPLFTIDIDGRNIGDGIGGLGYLCSIISPVIALIQTLGLSPKKTFFEQTDNEGIALLARTWRSNYITSEYELTRPTLRGIDIIIRPDKFQLLLDACRTPLVWREFIEGPTDVLAQ